MITHRRGRSAPGEETGAVAIVAAVSLLVFLLMASYVIDLGFMRADRIESQSVADLAVTAGAMSYNPEVGASAQAACRDALQFALANLPGVATATGGPTCDLAFPATYTCNPLVPVTAVYDADPYEIRITIPIADDDPRIVQQVATPAYDGVPCERLGVEIIRDRQFFLPIVSAGSSTQRGAIARSSLDGDDGEFVSLIVLQRQGCQTLANTGSGQIRVLNLVRMEDGQPVTYPGTITVDTVPLGCSGQQKVIQQASSTGSLTEAAGFLLAHGLQSADPGNAFIYNPSRVPANLRPRPVAGNIITRAPVDHIYNCKTAYPGWPSTTWSPARGGQPIDGCDSGDPAYIEALRNALAPIATAADAEAAGWRVYPDPADPDQACNDGTGSYGPSDFGGAQRLFVDCPISGGDTFAGDELTFDGFSHIVFRDGLVAGQGDEFTILGPTVVYIPQNGIDQAGGTVRFRDVFAYIDAPSGVTNERFRTSGTADLLAWQGPLDDTACASYSSGAPPAACFAPLVLWNNATAQNELAGNGNGGIIGTLFTPNAKFRFRGSATISDDDCTTNPDWADIATNTSGSFNLEAAQFFASEIDTAGGASVRMCPSPDTTIEVPVTNSSLIR